MTSSDHARRAHGRAEGVRGARAGDGLRRRHGHRWVRCRAGASMPGDRSPGTGRGHRGVSRRTAACCWLRVRRSRRIRWRRAGRSGRRCGCGRNRRFIGEGCGARPVIRSGVVVDDATPDIHRRAAAAKVGHHKAPAHRGPGRRSACHYLTVDRDRVRRARGCVREREGDDLPRTGLRRAIEGDRGIVARARSPGVSQAKQGHHRDDHPDPSTRQHRCSLQRQARSVVTLLAIDTYVNGTPGGL